MNIIEHFTEYSNIELYEGQLIRTEEMINMLFGEWKTIEKNDSDILLKNEGFER